jgi:hypothetical protein
MVDMDPGHNTHLHADVIFEKLLFCEIHTVRSLAQVRPMLAGNASALPFKKGRLLLLHQII